METTRLLAQITDADEEVRGEAIHELTHRMDDDIARAFLDIASSDADERVRADVIVGLGPVIDEAGMDYDDEEDGFEDDLELGPPISREMFETVVREVRALYEDESQTKLLRRRAFEVLVRDPQPWLMPEIRRRYASDDPEWKVTAIFAMGYVQGFEKEIAAAVQSESGGKLLFEAIRAAGSMEVTGAAKRIRDLVTSTDTDPEMRVIAIDALPHVDPDSYDILERLTRSDDADIAAAAEAALDELALAESLDDEDDDFDDDEDLDADDEDEKDERR